MLKVIQHLHLQDYVQTPWKNGQGVTSQIAIFPPEANITQMNFFWRLSFAPVTCDGPFSLFPGYERLLMIWEGDGLDLSGGRILTPLSAAYAFSGEEQVYGKLLKGQIRDIGVIYRRDQVQVAMEVVQEKSSCHLQTGTHYFFNPQKECVNLGQFQLAQAECLVLEGSGPMPSVQQVPLIHISMQSLSPTPSPSLTEDY